MKTFDITNINKELTNDVQKNIKIILTKYTNNFYIKYKTIKIPVTLHYNKNKKFWSLTYDVPNRTYDLFPFKIDFVDNMTAELNNITYIANIHKTDKISGSSMIELVLQINKILGAEKSYLYDGASVRCHNIKNDLSFIKLLEKGGTFYTKFGFEFAIDKYDVIKFNNNRDKHYYIMLAIKQCKKVTIGKVKKIYLDMLSLLAKIVKDQDFSKLKIYYQSKYDIKNIWLQSDNNYAVSELFYEINEMLKILNRTKEKYLYKLMIEIFNDQIKCVSYGTIIKYLVENQLYKITYKNIIIQYNLFDCFKILNLLRYYTFVYNY